MCGITSNPGSCETKLAMSPQQPLSFIAGISLFLTGVHGMQQQALTLVARRRPYTAAAITRAGFIITHLDTLGAADTQVPFPVAPQILGTAIRPVSGARSR
jgi:hypothetical protein